VLDPSCPRRFGITRIRRYRVTTLARYDDLATPGGRFADFVAFDGGRADFKREATTSVGCAVPGKDGWYEHAYEGATFLSFPGPCRAANKEAKDDACRAADPGGQCFAATTPDGTPHCTWTAEPIGEVRIAELSGVLDAARETERCAADASWEWSSTSHGPRQEADTGFDGACYWNGRANPLRNAERAEALDRLFVGKYPHFPPDIPPPICDGTV